MQIVATFALQKGVYVLLLHIACNKNILVLLSRGNSKEERRTWGKRILPYEIQGSGVILENLNIKHYIITMKSENSSTCIYLTLKP